MPGTMTRGSWTVSKSRPWRSTEAVHIGEARSLVDALQLRAAAEGGPSFVAR